MSASGLHVAILDQLVRPKVHIRLPSIMTPVREFFVAKCDESTDEVIARASSASFDQLPVVDGTGHVAGIVYVDELRRLPSGAGVSHHVVPLTECAHLRVADGISKALRVLHEQPDPQPAHLVVGDKGVVGLIHRSDLNKHPARTYFYLWLASLEMGLARLVALRLPTNDWIELLGEQAQILVLGKMQVERRRNNSIAPIEYLDLSDLAGIVAKNRDLQQELGFAARSKVKDEIGGLVQLRHSIMHPVRTLVSDAASLHELACREQRLRALTLTVQGILRRAERLG